MTIVPLTPLYVTRILLQYIHLRLFYCIPPDTDQIEVY